MSAAFLSSVRSSCPRLRAPSQPVSSLSSWSLSSSLSCEVTAGRRRGFGTSLALRTNYGFIGLGQMGYPMAVNLLSKLQKHDSLFVYDISQEQCKRLKSEDGKVEFAPGAGVKIVEDAQQVADEAETTILALPTPEIVKKTFDHILASPLKALEGFESRSASQRLFVDCSTIDVSTSSEVRNRINKDFPATYVDAPMSGGVVGARNATLTFMFGAPESEDVLTSRVKTVLEKMGKRIIHMGPPGAGLAGKLANNYLLAITNIGTCEAMNMGMKLGLRPEVLGELINSSSGRCWPSEVNNPVPGVTKGAPAERDYDGGFGIALMCKDLRLATQAAKVAGAELVLGPKATEVYRQVEEEHPRKDFSIVYKFLREGGNSQ